MRVIVGKGSCGIAAGANDVYEKLGQTISIKQKLKGTHQITGGLNRWTDKVQVKAIRTTE
jgi:hypothetical protein